MPTLVELIFNKDKEFRIGATSFKIYDESSAMYLRMIEPLIVNKTNYNMVVETESLKIFMGLLMCQRLYSDFEGGESGKKTDGKGELIKEQSDPSLLSHVS